MNVNGTASADSATNTARDMTEAECSFYAATWRQADAVDLDGGLIDSHAAASIMQLGIYGFLRIVRDQHHPLYEFVQPQIASLRPSGQRYASWYWRHRIGVAAYVYRKLSRDIGGPIGIDIPQDAIAAGRAYTPDVVRGALAMIEAARVRDAAKAEAAEGEADSEPAGEAE